MANFERIDNARRTLGLPDSATLDEIKNAYRRQAAEWHPDKLSDDRKKEGEIRFRELTEARDVLLNFCVQYRFSFKRRDVEGVRTDRDFRTDHMKQFYDEWMVNL